MSLYLDNSATMKPRREVINTVIPYMTDKWYNPSSIYSCGVKVKKDIEDAREKISKFINSNASEIYFTSGASESNSTIVRGWDDAIHYDKNNGVKLTEIKSYIITTPIEHKSIIEAVSNPMLYSEVMFCNVDENGLVNIEYLKNLLESLDNGHVLVSIGMANSEIGTIQDIKSIAELVHRYNGVFHTDATQAICHIPIDVKDMGIDMLSASGQKFGGLKGSGFLYKRNDIDIQPLIYGSQERSIRGGTENTVGIIGMAKAVELIERYAKPDMCQRIAYIRDYFIDKLENIGCKLNGSREHRLPNNINVTLPHGLNGESMLYCMDLCDVYISTGSACNSKSIEPSPVLSAIGLGDDAYNSIRITFPVGITKEEIDEVVSEMDRQIKILVNN